MSRFPLLAFVLLIAVLLVAGCERAGLVEPDLPDDPAPPTLADAQEIFTQSCARSGCHLGASAPFGLDLSEGEAFGNTVGVRSQEVPDLFRIEPGNPDASYLIQKVQGDPDIVGQRMPLGEAPLSDSQITLLRDWITAGAPDA